MSTYTEEMLELWMDEASDSEFGNVMQYQAFTFPCILNPIRSGFQMTPVSYNDKRDTIIDILRTDAVTSGLYAIVQTNPQSKRPIVSVGGIEFDLGQLESDDPTQPSIRIFASRHQ